MNFFHKNLEESYRLPNRNPEESHKHPIGFLRSPMVPGVLRDPLGFGILRDPTSFHWESYRLPIRSQGILQVSRNPKESYKHPIGIPRNPVGCWESPGILQASNRNPKESYRFLGILRNLPGFQQESQGVPQVSWNPKDSYRLPIGIFRNPIGSNRNPKGSYRSQQES